MAESQIQDVGLYNASSPPLDPQAYPTLNDLVDVTAGLVVSKDGAQASLSGNTTAEAWYRLETQMNAATKKLGEVNDAISKEIKSLYDNLKGEAGDAFNEFTNDVLKKSQDLYNTLDTKKYGLMVGNIGHCIQWFANRWWEIIQKSDDDRTEAAFKVKVLAAAQAEAATTTADLQTVLNELKSEMDKVDDAAEKALIKDLQDLLGEMGRQYNARGQDLAPLYIAGGEQAKSSSGEETPTGQMTPRLKLADRTEGQPLEPTEQGERVNAGVAPGDTTEGQTDQGQSDSGQGANGPLDAAKKAADDAIEGVKAKTNDPEAQKALDDAKKAVDDAIDGVAGGETPGSETPGSETSGTPGAQSPGASSPGASPDTSALDAAKKAATDAIDGVKSGTTDPEAQKALDDAKKAAGDAIDGLAGGTGSGDTPGTGVPSGISPSQSGPSSSSPGSSSPRSKALDDAKKAAQDAIDGLAGGTTDPEAQKALDDAKKAVGDAIDGLGGDSGTDGALDKAKDKAQDAIDGVKDKTDDPAAKKALDAAKDAVGKAIDDIDGGASPKDALDKAGAAADKALDDALAKTTDPETKQALQDAKDAVDKAIGDIDPDKAGALGDAKDKALGALDDVKSGTTDPQAQQALDAAKDAVGKAIDGVDASGDGPAGEAIKDAGDAANKALDDALANTTDPEARQALQDAKDKVADAIDGLDPDKPSTTSSGPGAEDPEAKQALTDARGTVDKALDDMIGKETDPEAKQALQDARSAVDKAIDGIKPSSSGLDAMKDFLGGGSGSSGGGGGGIGGGPGASQSAAALPRAQFDTDVAQQRGYSPAGVQTVSGSPLSPALQGTPAMSSSGTPMSSGMPMGMGGMGGMGGGQQNNEREPQIWLQADKDAWTDDPDSRDDGVIGRPTTRT
jgi:uncharacterized protein YukE